LLRFFPVCPADLPGSGDDKANAIALIADVWKIGEGGLIKSC
jgi:hypothetical protein